MSYVYYNLTGNLTNMTSIFTQANSYTNNMFGMAMLFVVWAIIFITLSVRTRTQDAMAVSLFTTALTAMPMWILGLVPDFLVPVLILAAAASVIFMKK